MTPEQAEFARRWEAGETYSQISAAMNRPQGTLSMWRKRFGLAPRPAACKPTLATPDHSAELIRMARNNIPLLRQAEKLGVSVEAVKRARADLGIKWQPRSDRDDPELAPKTAAPRKCLRCLKDFRHVDPPRIRRLCETCRAFAASAA